MTKRRRGAERERERGREENPEADM